MVDLTWHPVAGEVSAELRRPFLLMAFGGVFDAAEAATGALTWIRDRSETSEMAEIDPETYFNFQETRPLVGFDDDGKRKLHWPTTKVWACRTEGARDLLVMTGLEPHLRWRSFSEHAVELARRSRAEMVVTVGALVSMVPHTRPFAVTGSAGDPRLATRLNLDRPSYEGPTGIVGVINQRVDAAGIPIISLRVAVPHYVPAPPNPKATRALLRRLEATTGVTTDYQALDGDVTEWSTRVDAAVASDEESREYVEKLESQVDSNEELLPSGDDLAAELEAFLRDKRDPDQGE